MRKTFVNPALKSNRQRLREADAAVEENSHLRKEGAHVWAIFAVVLGELGGEVVVSEKTLELIGEAFDKLDYCVLDGPEEGTSIVRLLNNGQPFVRSDELLLEEPHAPDDASNG